MREREQERGGLTRRRKQRGSALPAVFALTMGVGALATGYTMRNVREHQRENFNDASTVALYRAFAQLEVVTAMVNASTYDETGQNAALAAALARGDGQFIDKDGWPTGVAVEPEGGTGSGLFDIVSTATVRGATRRISAMVRERQSFADFNYFVSSHPLGIAGGMVGTFPYPDAPEGSIHSNDTISFYFPDRHFRDPVTAVNPFQYTSGAHGPDHTDGANTHFHGPTSDSAERIDGLTDIEPSDYRIRSDALFDAWAGGYTPDETMNYANVWLLEDQVRVDFRRRSETIQGDPVPTWIDDYNYVQQSEVRPNRGWYQVDGTVLITAAWKTIGPVWHWGPEYQVWIESGGAGDTAGTGTGQTGYWETRRDWVYESWQERDYPNDVYGPGLVWEYGVYPAGHPNAGTYTATWNERVEPFGHYEDRPQMITISDHSVQDVYLNTFGTIYVPGDVYIKRVSAGTSAGRHPSGVNVLDGNLTLASERNVYIRESIVYGRTDDSGVLQTAYLNGNNKDLDYVPNPDYDAASVLGIMARERIRYEGNYLPDQAEINATLLAKNREVVAKGITINWDGTARTNNSYRNTRTSLRRLGGLVSNRRPASSYVDSNNVIVRGFVFGKSLFDTRQLVNPPRGFPTLNRPRMVAYVFKEVN